MCLRAELFDFILGEAQLRSLSAERALCVMYEYAQEHEQS